MLDSLQPFVTRHALSIIVILTGALLLSIGGLSYAIRLLRRQGKSEGKQKIRQPVTDGATGADVVANARIYAKMLDWRAQDANLGNKIAWFVVSILGFIGLVMVVYKVPMEKVGLVWALAGLAYKGADYFSWKTTRIACRKAHQQLSGLIMNWDQGTYRPELSAEERRQQFAEDVNTVISGEVQSFHKAAELASLPSLPHAALDTKQQSAV